MSAHMSAQFAALLLLAYIPVVSTDSNDPDAALDDILQAIRKLSETNQRLVQMQSEMADELARVNDRIASLQRGVRVHMLAPLNAPYQRHCPHRCIRWGPATIRSRKGQMQARESSQRCV